MIEIPLWPILGVLPVDTYTHEKSDVLMFDLGQHPDCPIPPPTNK